MPFSRRLFLRGAAGTLLALPFLESLAPQRAAADGTSPKRLLWWYTPNGHNMADWIPATTGDDYVPSPIIEPLSAWREHMTVVSGLRNHGCIDGAKGHAGSAGAFLTCAAMDETRTWNGVSIDQIAAAAIGSQTPFPSLEIGLEAGSSGNCSSATCGYGSNISWSGPETPRPKIVDPTALFQRLFGTAGATPPEELERRRVLRLSILDDVKGDIADLDRRLPVRDQLKLDEYTTAVRELELRIDALDGVTCEPGEPPADATDVPTRLELMADLMVKAMECDLTRVCTFMLGNAASNQPYDWLGMPEWHHALSHHGQDPETLAKLTRIGRWQNEVFARFLQRLADTTDPEGGTLLDSTVILMGSGMSDGHYHRNDDLPLLLFGGGGVFRHGHHLRSVDAPLADLNLAMLAAVGVEQDRLGVAGTGPLAGLT